MTTILLVIVILLLVRALPTWPYSSGWGYYPSGGLGLVLLILLVLALTSPPGCFARRTRAKSRSAPGPPGPPGRDERWGSRGVTALPGRPERWGGWGAISGPTM